MKTLLTGLFLATSAFPTAFVVGVMASYLYGRGFPSAFFAAACTATAILGLAFFVFMGGLVSKVEMPKPASSGKEWGKE